MTKAIDFSKRVWLLVDNTHAERLNLVNLLNSRSKEFWERNRLSVVISDDGTRSVIKVEGALVSSWRNSAAARALMDSGIILQTRTMANHDDVKALLRTAAWSRQWDDEANWPAEPPLRVAVREFVENLWATT